jgi:hypothetical protein
MDVSHTMTSATPTRIRGWQDEVGTKETHAPQQSQYIRANVQITDLATGAVVCDSPKSGSCEGLRSGRFDRRPRVEELLLLEPGVVHSWEIEMARLVWGLKVFWRYCCRERS